MRAERVIKGELAIDFLLDVRDKIVAYFVYYNLKDIFNNDANIIPIPIDTKIDLLNNLDFDDIDDIFSMYTLGIGKQKLGIFRENENVRLCVIESDYTGTTKKITIGNRTIDVAYCLNEKEDDFVYKWRSKTPGVNLITSKSAPKFI